MSKEVRGGRGGRGRVEGGCPENTPGSCCYRSTHSVAIVQRPPPPVRPHSKWTEGFALSFCPRRGRRTPPSLKQGAVPTGLKQNQIPLLPRLTPARARLGCWNGCRSKRAKDVHVLTSGWVGGNSKNRQHTTAANRRRACQIFLALDRNRSHANNTGRAGRCQNLARWRCRLLELFHVCSLSCVKRGQGRQRR